MKFIKLLLLAIIFTSTLTYAQEEKLAQLKTPSSPAANILDMAPGAVLSPKSYQSLEAAIYSNFLSDGKLSVPDNFSLEFTPFWFKDHGMSLKAYLAPQPFLEQLKRTSSFSLASTQSYLLGDSTKSNSLSFGYRASFFLGGPKDKEQVTNMLRQTHETATIQTQLTGIAVAALNPQPASAEDFMNSLEPMIHATLVALAVEEQVIEKFSDTLRTVIIKLKKEELNPAKVIDVVGKVSQSFFKMDNSFTAMKDYIINRYGFYIDIAYANFLNFPTNNFEYSFIPRQSIWITPSYRFSGKLKDFKFMGVLRYQWNNTTYFGRYFPGNKSYRNNLDYGAALSGTFDKFSVQLELVGRTANTEIIAGVDHNNQTLYRKEQESDFQYLGTLSYRLSDQVVLSYTLGKNFQVIGSADQNLISLLSLNFGFGAPTATSAAPK